MNSEFWVLLDTGKILRSDEKELAFSQVLFGHEYERFDREPSSLGVHADLNLIDYAERGFQAIPECKQQTRCRKTPFSAAERLNVSG